MLVCVGLVCVFVCVCCTWCSGAVCGGVGVRAPLFLRWCVRAIERAVPLWWICLLRVCGFLSPSGLGKGRGEAWAAVNGERRLCAVAYSIVYRWEV